MKNTALKPSFLHQVAPACARAAQLSFALSMSLLASASLSQAAFAQAIPGNPVLGPVVMPVLTNAPIQNVFVPVGFDDNDTVEVIVHGHFKDSCNKVGAALGSVDEDTKEIGVALRSLKYEGNECIEMEVPFLQSIKLGQLPAGTYTVNAQNASATVAAKTLQVGESSTTNADDSLYAPVDAVEFAPVAGRKGAYELSVSGIFPRSELGCMKLKELKVLPYEEVLIVLPIAEFVYDPSQCRSSSPFQRQFRVSKQIEMQFKRDTLIHVRVLNGQSLNKVIEIED